MPHALIVDDNWYNRDIFRMALETAGYKVTQSGDGADGLGKLEAQSYDLLILDLQMPKLGGTEVLKRLKTDPRHENMRIVIVTANPHMATDELEAMVDFVMLKPINVMKFSDFVRRLKETLPGQS